jgi:hypothetical protein
MVKISERQDQMCEMHGAIQRAGMEIKNFPDLSEHGELNG